MPNVGCALEQLWANKLRSLLTVLGVVIAVSSTIVVVSVVQGLTVYVSGFLQGMGSNAIWVWPYRPPDESGQTLGRVEMSEADVAAVEQACGALRAVSPLIRRPDTRVSLGNREATTMVEGVSAPYHAIRNFPVEVGRPFAPVDVERGHYVCIVGREVVRKLRAGERERVVGRYLLMKGRRFRVVGVLGEKGGLLGNSQDDVVLVPFTTALKLFPASRRKVAFTASAVTEDTVPEARAQIANLLRRRHGLSAHQPNDFNVFTQDEILKTFNRLSLVATVVLAGIVGISLLVGGIGIMNVMLVSVTERTREIGLRKAVGARRRDILLQFLTEATTLSVFGGGLGIALGDCLCALASQHPQMVDVVVPWWVVALGFGISALTGVTFGLLPAIKAALMNPIDSLRNE